MGGPDRGFFPLKWVAPISAPISDRPRFRTFPLKSVAPISDFAPISVTIDGWPRFRPSDLENTFQQELQNAEGWYAGVAKDEADWINEGLNPETEFGRKYYQEPTLYEDSNRNKAIPFKTVMYFGAWCLLLGLVAFWFVIFRLRITRKRTLHAEKTV